MLKFNSQGQHDLCPTNEACAGLIHAYAPHSKSCLLHNYDRALYIWIIPCKIDAIWNLLPHRMFAKDTEGEVQQQQWGLKP